MRDTGVESALYCVALHSGGGLRHSLNALFRGKERGGNERAAWRPKCPFPGKGMRWPLTATLLFIGVIGALALWLPPTLTAQETLTVRGRMVNGTAGAETPGGLPVLMLITGQDGTLAGTGQAQANPDGSFYLEDVALIEGAGYNISVDYGGVFYSQSLLPGQLADEVIITVHEATEDATIMRVDRQVMVISDFDAAERTATVTEFVRFANPTDRTLRANLETARPGMFSFMRFALPPDASDITVQSNLRGGDVISVGSGFALTAAVPPGEHSVDFAYNFPYQGGSLEFRNSLPQGAAIFQILVPQRFTGLEIIGLTPRPAVGIGDEIYHAWEGRDIPPGVGLQLRFDGLPQPGVLALVGSTLAGGRFWTTAIPSAMGAVLLAFLLLGVLRRHRPSTAIAEAVPGSSDSQQNGATRADMVATLAALDEHYHAGALEEDDYHQRRAALVDRVLGNRPDPSEGPVPPEGRGD